MLDNLVINIRTILPSAKPTTEAAAIAVDSTLSRCSNRCQDDDKFNKNYNNESAIDPFLKYRSNCDDNAILNKTTTNRTMLHVVRSYFSHLYQSKRRRPASSDIIDSNNDAIMLPRVYNYPPDLHGIWDPIELKVKEKCLEDIDNVIDKFVRVIRVNENSSPIRPAQFYVYIAFNEMKI